MGATPYADASVIWIGKEPAIRREGKRKPEVREITRLDAIEGRGGDADNLEVFESEGHPLSDCSGAGAEAPLPKGIAQDGDGMSICDCVVVGLNEPPDGWFDAQNLETAAADAFGANVLALASGVIEYRRPKPAGEAHREEIRLIANGLAEKFILRVTESVRLSRLVLGAKEGRHKAGDLDELVRRWRRERPEKKRVDQSECGRARTDGKSQRHDGGKARGPVSRKHAKAESKIGEEGSEPERGLDFVARLSKQERIAELAASGEFGFAAGHAGGHQVVHALFEVELEFVVQGSGSPFGAEGVGYT
jgi:hypothetical protein